MKKISACLSHHSDEWSTPSNIYKYFIDHGYFDPCPMERDFDGLDIDWKDKNFVNPPYSQVKMWVDKAINEHKKGKVVTMLLASRTDTKYFRKLHDYGCVFQFITGRLVFGNKKNAPFPSVLIHLTGLPSVIEFDYRDLIYESKFIK